VTRRPFENIAWKDLPDWFQELVENELAPRQLTAYKLRQGGMSMRPISRAMGVTLSTVKGTLDRADDRIRHALDEREAVA